MRILVIEDEPKIAEAVKKGLEQEAFAVDIALDGESGYDLALGEKYDVIVLDRMLPGLDGLDICTKIRAEGSSTPILMLTAKTEIPDRVEGLNAGADDYLPKPFAFEELLARVRALTRRPEKVIGDTLSIADLTLDTTGFKVSRKNKSIILSKKEFSLLEYLLRNKNTIVTKDQIIASVWNYDADVLPNTVEVYIGYLRQKIDKPFRKSPSLIHTVRGFGYKIGEEP